MSSRFFFIALIIIIMCRYGQYTSLAQVSLHKRWQSTQAGRYPSCRHTHDFLTCFVSIPMVIYDVLSLFADYLSDY